METQSPHPCPVFVGIDVGGTNIKYGLVDIDGTIIASQKFPTEQHLGPADAMTRAADNAKQLILNHSVAMERVVAAGLGTPGSMDTQAGMILTPSNLPAWRNFQIRDELSAQLKLPVVYCNDANAAAMGEYWIGGGKNFSSMVLLTLGTGVGGGIIVHNQLIDGNNDLGGECGHVAVDYRQDARMCSCGIRGHLEAYCSATAVVGRYVEKLGNRLVDPAPDAEEIARLAEGGDPVARSIVLETADYLARGLAVFTHVIDPQLFVLGGAMNFGGSETELGREFIGRVVQEAGKQIYGRAQENVRVEFASLGGEAGWIGAAGIARMNLSLIHI